MNNTIAQDFDQPELPSNPNEAADLPANGYPAHIAKKYTVVIGEKVEPTLLYEKSGKSVAIHDRQTALATELQSPAIIKDMVAIAHHRGWAVVKVSGSDEFKEAAWIEARKLGLEVNGYTPTPLDQARLEEVQKLFDPSPKQPNLRRVSNAIKQQADRLKETLPFDPTRTNDVQVANIDAERLAKKWLKAAPHVRAGDPLLTNAQSRFVVLKAAIAEAFKGDKELIDRMTHVARVGIGEELAHGRVFKPQMAAAQPMESIAKPKPPKETLRRPRMK